MSSRRDATWPPGTLARAFANSPKLARDDKERNGVTTSFNPFRGRGRERVNAYPRDVSELTRIPLEGHGVRGVVCPRRRQGRHSQHTKSGTGAFGYIAGLCFRICVAAPPPNRPHRGRFCLAGGDSRWVSLLRAPAPVGCPVRVRVSTRTTPPFSQLTSRTASRRRQPKRVRKHDGHPRMRRCSKVRSTAGAGGRGARACRRAGTRRHEPTTRRPASRTLHAVLPACGPASTRKHSSTSRRGRSHLCA